MQNLRQSLVYAVYFAPRGRERLLALGEELSQRHLSFNDKLVGIVGDAGSGKSLIIRGMFPGLTLSNDDDGIDTHKIMQVRRELDLDTSFRNSTYHLDMRFQMAFTQMFEIVDFVKGALDRGRRVIIEHFDLLYPFLHINADIMLGIGEEIIVTRPTIFGPLPKDLYNIVFNSLKKRRMTHTAEDLTMLVLKRHYDLPGQVVHGEVRGGFVFRCNLQPDIDIYEVEEKVKGLIDIDLDVSYYDENHILLGENEIIPCTGPRIHVRSTGEIENFNLIKDWRYDQRAEAYCLVGMVGESEFEQDDLNRIKGEQL